MFFSSLHHHIVHACMMCELRFDHLQLFDIIVKVILMMRTISEIHNNFNSWIYTCFVNKIYSVVYHLSTILIAACGITSQCFISCTKFYLEGAWGRRWSSYWFETFQNWSHICKFEILYPRFMSLLASNLYNKKLNVQLKIINYNSSLHL